MSGALKHFFDQIYYPCLDGDGGPAVRGVRARQQRHGWRGEGGRRVIVTGLRWRRAQAPVEVVGDPRARGSRRLLRDRRGARRRPRARCLRRGSAAHVVFAQTRGTKGAQTMTSTSTHAARVRTRSTTRSSTPTATSSRSGRCCTTRSSPTWRSRRRRRSATASSRNSRRRSTRHSSLANRSDPAVRDEWRAMPSWWGWQTDNVRDRATSHLPALLYERLDEIGIDFTILYPSMALGYFEVSRRGAVVGAVPRGEPLPRAAVRAATATGARSARWCR